MTQPEARHAVREIHVAVEARDARVAQRHGEGEFLRHVRAVAGDRLRHRQAAALMGVGIGHADGLVFGNDAACILGRDLIVECVLALGHRVGGAFGQHIRHHGLAGPERERRHAVGKVHAAMDAVDALVAQRHREREGRIRIHIGIADDLPDRQTAVLDVQGIDEFDPGDSIRRNIPLRVGRDRDGVIAVGLLHRVGNASRQVGGDRLFAAPEGEGRHAIDKGHVAIGAGDALVRQRHGEGEDVPGIGCVARQGLLHFQTAGDECVDKAD